MPPAVADLLLPRGGLVEITRIEAEHRQARRYGATRPLVKSTFHPARDTAEWIAAGAPEKVSADGWNLYFSPISLTEEPEKGRGSRSLRGVANCLWADLDLKAPGGREEAPDLDLAAAKELVDRHLSSLGQPLPHVYIATGWGMHLYWALDEPVPATIAAGSSRFMAAALRKSEVLAPGVDNVGDVTRLMRLWAGINWRGGEQEPREVSVMEVRDDPPLDSQQIMRELPADVLGQRASLQDETPRLGLIRPWLDKNWLMMDVIRGVAAGDTSHPYTSVVWDLVFSSMGWKKVASGSGESGAWKRQGAAANRDRSVVVYKDDPVHCTVWSDAAEVRWIRGTDTHGSATVGLYDLVRRAAESGKPGPSWAIWLQTADAYYGKDRGLH